MSVHSSTPTENVRARLTARANSARAGNARVGFTPKDTALGPFYVWTMVRGPLPLEPAALGSWTAKKR